MKRSFSLFLAVAAFSAATPVDAADQCISPEAEKKVSDCPTAGPTKFDLAGHGKTPAVSFHGKVEDLKKGSKVNKPTNPDVSGTAGFRDQRKTALQQRALALLVTEIKSVESLIGVTKADSPDRVMLLRKLAEDYVELENAAFREKIEAETKRDLVKATNPGEAGKLQATAQSRDKTVALARKAAISNYKTIIEEYAGKPSKRFSDPPPAYPLLDEVYYYLAYEYEQAQDSEHARETYLALIDNTPKSKYIVNAYLAFGELFFQEAQNDPSKWEPARQAYEKVVAQPPPQNAVYGYAWYKLAYVFWNQGTHESYARALDAFKRTIDYGVKFPTLPNAAKLAESARRDVIPVYALSGKPRDAYKLFKSLSGDPEGSNAITFKMLDDLGINYIDTGHYPEAVELFRDLISRNGESDKSCSYQSRITEATMAMKGGNKESIIHEIDNQTKRYQSFITAEHAGESKFECANRTSQLLTETAMAWHIEAVGSGGQRGTGDRRTMDASAALYKRVTELWKADDYSKFTFPRLVKEDWPSIYRIRYNMADLLYAQERWADCGPAFDGVVLENPEAPEAAEAAYAASLCYQKTYLNEHAKAGDRKGTGAKFVLDASTLKDETAKYATKELSKAQQDMVASFSRYVCYIKPKPEDAERMKELVEVKYARAYTYFEQHHWEEAALIFRDISTNHADNERAGSASQLYLECLNILMFHTTPKRSACVDNMGTDVPKFIELFCTGDKANKNSDTCTTLAKVNCDIQRLQAQRIVEEADKGASNAIELYEKAGQAYLDLWEKYGAAPIRNKQPTQCEKLDEIVYNAARSFQAGRLVASAIKTRMVLLNPQYGMDTSPLAKKAMYEIGGNWQAIAVYDQAAEWYERFAKANKAEKNADSALSDAIVLRLGLGQESEAISSAKLFQTNYPKSKAKAAQIAYAVGAHYAEQERWDQCKQALQQSARTIEEAPLDIQLQAHATLGRCQERSKGGAAARGEYKKVLGLWGDGASAIKKIESEYKDEPEDQRQRRLGRALEAVGEALFIEVTDREAKEVDTIKFPTYQGSGAKDDVSKHIKDKIAPWFEKKQKAISEVEKDYGRILELKPAPPPKWVIAAASRAGLMWGSFVTEFRRAPIPKKWEQDPEIRGAYFQGIDEKSAPYKEKFAKPALKRCLDEAVKFQYFDEHSRACEQWLSENYKKEYHIVDELRGAATRANNVLDERSSPLKVGGQMWSPSAADKAATEKAAASDKNAKSEPTN